MTPCRGYVVSPNATQDLTTAWLSVPIALTSLAASVDRGSSRPLLPSAGYLSDLELDLQDLAGGATAIQAMLYYNITKRKRLAGPTDSATFEIDNAATTFGGIGFALAKSYRTPVLFGATPAVYLNLRVNAGTAKLSALGARLHWTDAGR